MILIVTNKQDFTADFVILKLQQLRIPFIRLNTEDFPQHIATTLKFTHGNGSPQVGHVTTDMMSFNLSDISGVWYRRPAKPLISQEIVDSAARQFAFEESTELTKGLWNLIDAVWVSRPDKIMQAESKVYQLSVAQKIGFSVPNTIITNDPRTAKAFYEEFQAVIYKPMRSGKIFRNDEVSLIFTSLVEGQHSKRFDSAKFAPVLLQEYVPKEVEIRATVVGNSVFSVELITQHDEISKIDWRRKNAFQIEHRPHSLPFQIELLCKSLVERLGLNFGAIDLILSPSGEYVFLEINPNGQWAWIQQVLPGMLIRESLISLLTGETI